jgi:hypothetical protein
LSLEQFDTKLDKTMGVGINNVGQRKMKTIILTCLCFVFVSAQASDLSLAQCLKERGQPVVVASGFRIEKMPPLRTVSIFGLDIRGALGRLVLPEEHVLVYTSDLRFAQWTEIHFKYLLDPTQRSGSTMFSTLMWGTALDLVRFDVKGRFLNESHVVIDVAYLEEGTEGHLVRMRPQRPVPNHSPEPTPSAVH